MTDLDADRAWRPFDTVAWIWLGLAAAWLIVLIITDLPVWPLAIWLALSFGNGRRPCRPPVHIEP